MERVCVFCGSSPGRDPDHREAARRLGEALLSRGLGLVYGGASVGLMGVVADTVLAGGGEVVGVIPSSLARKEVAHGGLSDLRVVGSMHERKALMVELAGGFVALPGGIGTLEELFEIWTWGQLGFHRHPVGLLNVGGYYDPLLAFLDRAVDEGFLKPVHRSLAVVDEDPERLLQRFEGYQAPEVTKWVEREEL